KLTAKFALLNKIGVVNWVPTSHTSEHPDICTAADVPCVREADLSLDYRLFEGSHAADIAGPSTKKSNDTLSKKQMIADLKETSKALEERK
ncbi:envelope-like protein, partial [Trifolium medium]|nr:envelope-like protein [Trifolium medium]